MTRRPLHPRRIIAALLLGLVLLAPGRRADADDDDSPGAIYLIDGGALPFFWGALGARLAIDRWLRPPAEPRWLWVDEVGLPEAEWETPGWLVTAAGGAAATAMLLGDDSARWNHAKGLAETLATGSVITAALKVTFGRRRPDYRGPGLGRFGGESRSFLSGHTTQAFEIATYSVLYLRDHGLAGSSGWARGAAFAGLYAGAALVGAERVLHNRHHLSDVIAGAVLGTTIAVAFYTYQESRLPDEDQAPSPDTSARSRKRGGLPLAASWAWRF